MTWVTTTDGPSQAPLAQTAPGSASAGSDPSRETWNLPRAMWHEEAGWDDQRVLVVEASGLRALGTAAAMEGYLWIPLEAPRPMHRGKLALHIEESIESALQQRGAPFPGVGASTDLDASLGDQLYRARLVEMRGIALGIPDLGNIANLSGVLEAEDSAVLRWWLAAAMDRPVRVVLSAENRAYRVYPSPVAFGTLLEGLRGSFSDAPSPRAPSAETAQSVVAMELSDLPPGVVEDGGADVDAELSAEVDLPELDRALGLEAASEPAPAPSEPGQPSAASEEAPVGASAAQDGSIGAQEPAPQDEVVAESASGEPDAGARPATSIEPEALGEATVEALAARSQEAVLGSDVVAALDSEVLVEPAEEHPAAASPGPATEAATEHPSEPAEASPASTVEAADVPVASQPDAAQPVAARPDAARPDAAQPVASREPAAEAPTKAAAEHPAARSTGPIVKSSISMDAARRAAAGRRVPFIVAAEDDSELAETAPSNPAGPEVSASASAPSEVEAPTAGAEERESAGASSAAPRSAAAQAAAPRSAAAQAAAPQAASEDPFDAFARQHWKSWIRELESARGPKPLALVERMFVTAYTRLDAAVQRGIGDDSARDALDQWRSSFAKSYTEAFDALRVRGKRPTMVLDVPELAQRVGRLHGARRVQLLLVDGMRFDLGMMVQDRLKQCADASLTERMLLWSALPSTTTIQLELLGKGPDGLRDMAPQEEEAPAVVARGRAAHGLRRIRTGRRELFKLDIVEAALREMQETNQGEARHVRASLPAIAEDVANAVADHFAKQAPRTLVVLFGDHGFRLNDDAPLGEGMTQGGSSPEEVLVPAFAWLTGAVH